MHAIRLVELAAIVTNQHRLLLQQKTDASFWAADQFWVLNRARVNEWSRALQRCESLKPRGEASSQPAFWQTARPVIEEVLYAEVCTRVWCATLSTIEEQRQPGDFDPIARSVFIANLEARRRALRLILVAKGLDGIGTTSINELRLACECWTDFLLAELPVLSISKQYCFDRLRVKRIFETRKQQINLKAAQTRQQARMLAMHYRLATAPNAAPICGELNSEIAALILACLPAAAFDGCGAQRLELQVSADMMSVDVLADLYGTVGSTRFDSRRGMKDKP